MTASGIAIPADNAYAGFTKVFEDDFTTDVAVGSWPPDPTKWGVYTGPDTSGNGVYSPDKVFSVSNDRLHTRLHTTQPDGIHRVGAALPKHGQMPNGGIFMFVLKLTASGPGYKVAPLLWPDSDVWNEGELNWPEGNLNGYMSAFAHKVGAPTQQAQKATTTNYYSAWHRCSIKYLPDDPAGRYVDFWIDGASIWKVTNTDYVPTTPFHFVWQVETAIGAPEPADGVDVCLELDWIKIWAKD